MLRNQSSRLLLRLVVDFATLVSVGCVALIAVPHLMPPERTHGRTGFFCSDATLRYPHTQSMLSRVHKTLLVIALPACLILIVELLRVAFAISSRVDGRLLVRRTRQFQFVGLSIPTFISECYMLNGIYFFGLALLTITTEVTKRQLGRLRPFFFSVCQPQAANGTACSDPADSSSRYIEHYTCYELTAAEDLLVALRQSFPSGTVAAAVYALGFLVLYLQARLTARGWLRVLRTLLQFACLLAAALVAWERLATHQSHAIDVIAGALIGLICAWFVGSIVGDLFAAQPANTSTTTRNLRVNSNHIYGYYDPNAYAYAGYIGPRYL